MSRYFIILLALTALTSFAFAQEETLFGDRNVRFGGFGSPMVYYTSFNGESSALVGGQGALVINKAVYLGLGGFGFATHPDAGLATMDGALRDTDFEGGYGGALIGTILRSDDLIHSTADVLIGGGAVNRVRDEAFRHHDEDSDWNSHRDRWEVQTDGYFVVQPMAHVEVNLLRWMRMDLGAGYRLVSGVSRFGLSNSDVSGVVAGGGFRFGRF